MGLDFMTADCESDTLPNAPSHPFTKLLFSIRYILSYLKALYNVDYVYNYSFN